jgi:hypothetical protein
MVSHAEFFKSEEVEHTRGQSEIVNVVRGIDLLYNKPEELNG